VAHLFEALRYKPEGRGFDSRRCHSGRTMALGSNQPLNSNEYQEYFLGSKGGRYVGLKTLSSSRADCLEIWEPSRPGTVRTCIRSVMGLLLLKIGTGDGHFWLR